MPTAAASPATTADSAALVQALSEENAQLKRQLAWFKEQLFGSKSEKRVIDNPEQPLLTGLMGEPVKPLPPGDKQKITYERGKAKKNRDDDCVTDSGLRFGPEVAVKTITLDAPELSGPDADQYEIIGYKTSHRLAQHHSAYEVLRFQRPVLKHKGSGAVSTTPAAFNVLDNSIADVSFLVGMLVDKFLYHLPLYRQHQRLTQSGIDLSRGTLTNLCKRSIELLRPIAEAQLAHILQSRVLSMDETPIKAGPTKNKQGKGVMKQGWFWPLMGDQDEIAFTYSSGRGRAHIEGILENLFTGTLVSDGYAAYSSYAAKNEQITHANCWVHYLESRFMWSRRQPVESTCRIEAFRGWPLRDRTRHNIRPMNGDRRLGGIRCKSHYEHHRVWRHTWQTKSGVPPAFTRARCIHRAVARLPVTAAIPA